MEDEPDREVPPDMVKFLEEATTMAKDAKLLITRNGPEDLPPMCTWIKGDDMLPIPVADIMTHLWEDGIEAHPVDILGQLLPQMRVVNGPADGVLFIVEGYFVRIEPGEHKEAKRKFRRGSLAKRFAEGDSTVSEAIVITMADRDDLVSRFIPFRYGDGGVIWDEISDNVSRTRFGHTTDTNVPQVIMLAFGEPGADTN